MQSLVVAASGVGAAGVKSHARQIRSLLCEIASAFLSMFLIVGYSNPYEHTLDIQIFRAYDLEIQVIHFHGEDTHYTISRMRALVILVLGLFLDRVRLGQHLFLDPLCRRDHRVTDHRLDHHVLLAVYVVACP